MVDDHEMCQIADSESEMLDITIEEARAENRFLKQWDPNDDEPDGFCCWCDKPMKPSDTKHLRQDTENSYVVYCSQECIDKYWDAH